MAVTSLEKVWGPAGKRECWTAFSPEMFSRFMYLGLSTGEIALVLALFSSRREGKTEVFPSNATISKRTGMNPSEIARFTQSLTDKGLLTTRVDKLTKYNLAPLMEALDFDIHAQPQVDTNPTPESASNEVAQGATQAEPDHTDAKHDALQAQLAAVRAQAVKKSKTAVADNHPLRRDTF